jgi:hypothetical protein
MASRSTEFCSMFAGCIWQWESPFS